MIGCSPPVPYGTGRRFASVCTANRRHVDALVLGEIARLRPTRILDVGCANGRFARELDFATVIGIELDEELAALAAEVCDEVLVGDVEMATTLEAAEAFGPYEAVLALDVIEHLVAPETALRRLSTLLVAEGRLVLSVPNLLYYRERLRLLSGRFETSPTGGVYDATHLHYFSQRELEHTLERAGLVVERLVGAGNVRPGRRIASWPYPARLGHRLASALAHTSARVRPQLFARAFVVVARPREAAR